MLQLQLHHIVDLYCWVDELVPSRVQVAGRPRALSDSEMITMLVWATLTGKHKTIQGIYDTVLLYLWKEFPNLPEYSAFARLYEETLPTATWLLETLLDTCEPVRIMDSTMLPVCKPHRTDSHRVAKGVAAYGKNHQGWHYGFKLHASISLDGSLCGLAFTPANIYDAQVTPAIINSHTRLAVGDTLYGASVMRKHIWETYGTVIISPPFPKQNKKVAAPWQTKLLNLRSKIESVFDYLKEHLNLVTSLCRSVTGYLMHYVRILLSYQILALTRKGAMK